MEYLKLEKILHPTFHSVKVKLLKLNKNVKLKMSNSRCGLGQYLCKQADIFR